MSYRACEIVSNRGAKPRRWVEIQHIGTRGGVLRVVARTPTVLGTGDRANAEIRDGLLLAQRMVAGLEAA